LCLDLEGGVGGSSRSLFHTIEARDPAAWTPLVVTRIDGAIAERYGAIGVEHMCLPALPSFRPSERKNALAFAMWLWGWRRWRRIFREVCAFAGRGGATLVHVNHESLALSGALIAARLRLPWTCHVRTQLIPGRFARFVCRKINRHAAHIVFITEPNRRHFSALVGDEFSKDKTCVVHNPAPKDPDRVEPLADLGRPEHALRVVSLSSFSPNRGVDRIVDVALALRRRGRTDIVFYLCGRLANKRLLPILSNTYLDDIRKRVVAAGLEDMVLFPGYVSEPERALAACHVLIKLTRQANPWGRDIIEAMAAARPVVTLGEFEDFVSHEETGFIRRDFDADRIATDLERLADDSGLRARMGAAAAARAAALFDRHRIAAEMTAVFRIALTKERSGSEMRFAQEQTDSRP
jgi:glycosyltransferase involved in cell wall biosynthesis